MYLAPRGMLAKEPEGLQATSGPSTGCYQQSKERSGSETVWGGCPLPARALENHAKVLYRSVLHSQPPKRAEATKEDPGPSLDSGR